MQPTGFQIKDGVIRHANGVLRATTSGLERSKLHVELMHATEADVRKAGCPEAASRALAAFSKDPSLLLESIPKSYPLQRKNSESYVNADAVWNNISTWYGSWAGRFFSQCSFPVIKFALEAGIHPDDGAVWSGYPLLSDDDFGSNADNIALALSHGASPDPVDEGPGNTYLMRFLRDIQGLIDGSASTTRDAKALQDALLRANLLLDAKPARLDFDPYELRQRNGSTAALGLKTPIGMLTDAAGTKAYADCGLDKQVYALMGKLHRAGASIDCPNGVLRHPPVLQCLRAMNIDGACELVRLGCRTDIEAIPRPGGTGKLESLMVEAADAGGDAYKTRIVAAMMERDMAAAAKSVPVTLSEPEAPRRRMRAV